MQQYFHQAGTYVTRGFPFTLGEIQYPANWFDCASDDEINAAGLAEVQVVGEPGDDRYYTNSDITEGAQRTITAELKPIETLRSQQSALIDAAWAEADNGTFEYGSKLFAADRESKDRLNGVAATIALTGAFPATFPGVWKALDKTLLSLASVDDFKALYTAMSAKGTANFIKAQTLKGQVAAATTLEQIVAVTW